MHHDRALLLLALLSVVVLLIFGTFLFQVIEGLSVIDAFYFTGMTMFTVGMETSCQRPTWARLLQCCLRSLQLALRSMQQTSLLVWPSDTSSRTCSG
jgi:nucleoside recognition membrane protein YjiH